MLPARTRARLLPAALLALAATLTCSLPVAGAPAPAGGDGWTADAPEARTVAVGRGHRARLLTSDGGPTVLEARPGRRGVTPGLTLATGPSGTALHTAGDAEPTVLAGRAPWRPAARSEELVELRFVARDRFGRPAPADVAIFDVATGAVDASRWLPAQSEECSADPWAASSCLLVPPGTYSVLALVTTNPADRPSTEVLFSAQSVALVGDPEIEVHGDRTVALDARRARRVQVATPGRRTSVAQGGALELGFSRTAANGVATSRETFPGALLEDAFYVQPTDPVTTGSLDTLTRLRLEAPAITMAAGSVRVEPDYYEPHWFSDVDSRWPVWDGTADLRLAYVPDATPTRLAALDLRGAVAVFERSPEHSVAALSNAAARAGARLVAIHNDGPGDNDDPNGPATHLLRPTVRLSRAEGLALRGLPGDARVRVGGESASPYVYDLVIKERDRIPVPSYSYPVAELATQVRRFHAQPTKDWTASESAFHYQPGDVFSYSRSFPLREVPRVRTEYRIPDPDTHWNYSVTHPEFPYNHAFPDDEPVTHLGFGDQTAASYRPRQRTTQHFATAPFTATIDEPMERSGDLIRVDLHGLVDSSGNWGNVASDADSGFATELRVLADGTYVGGTTARPSGIAAVPTDTSTVTVAFTTSNPQSWAELSTRSETRWTFPTAWVPEGSVETQPVLVADYDVPVDLRNRVTPDRSGRAGFEVTVGHHALPSAGPVRTVEVEASYDAGATWRAATVTPLGAGRHRVTLPPGSGPVSLRLHAADGAGSTLDQTVVGAFEVR